MAPANSRAKKVQAAVIVSAKIKAIIDGVEAIQAKLVNFQAQSEAAHSEATQSSLADIKATVDELQTKARDVSSQMDFMAATLKHSEPISNTDWRAVAVDVRLKGLSANAAKNTYELLSRELGFAEGDDENCVAGPSGTGGGGSAQKQAADTTPNKRATPAPKKSAAGVKKATGRTGSKAAGAPKGKDKGKEKAIAEDTDEAMGSDTYDS